MLSMISGGVSLTPGYAAHGACPSPATGWWLLASTRWLKHGETPKSWVTPLEKLHSTWAAVYYKCTSTFFGVFFFGEKKTTISSNDGHAAPGSISSVISSGKTITWYIPAECRQLETMPIFHCLRKHQRRSGWSTKKPSPLSTWSAGRSCPCKNHCKWSTWTGWWFLATPLKNMTSSIGMMTFPILLGK